MFDTEFEPEDYESIKATVPHDMLCELHRLRSYRQLNKKPYTLSALIREGLVLLFKQENKKKASRDVRAARR